MSELPATTMTRYVSMRGNVGGVPRCLRKRTKRDIINVVIGVHGARDSVRRITMNNSNVHQLRPNVTPVTPPAIKLIPLLIIVIATIPWWVGVWQIVRWIWR